MARHHLRWSGSEKKIARNAFDAALRLSLEKVMAEFKAKSAAASTPGEMWNIERYLRRQRREIDAIFDYRYSQLPFVFAQLIHAGYMEDASLGGLSDEKLEIIRDTVSALRRLREEAAGEGRPEATR